MAFKLKDLFASKKEQQNAVIQSRSLDYDTPQKVFIEREGPFYEWSTDEPSLLKTSIYDLLKRFLF